jgi:hypothetical protein
VKPAPPKPAAPPPARDGDWGEFPPPPDFPEDWDNLIPPGEEWLLDPDAAVRTGSRQEEQAPEPAAVEAAPSAAPVAAIREPLESHPEAIVVVPESAGINYLVPPVSLGSKPPTNDQPHMVKVILRANGDKERDVRRLRRIVGILRSCPGRDRFVLLVFENGRSFQIEFPNDTTGISDELLSRLHEQVGRDNVIVEDLILQ